MPLQTTRANKTAEWKTFYMEYGTKVIIAYILIKPMPMSKREHVMLFVSAYLTKSVSVPWTICLIQDIASKILFIYSGDITTLKYTKYGFFCIIIVIKKKNFRYTKMFAFNLFGLSMENTTTW